MKLCSVYGCDNKNHAKGFCRKHYTRLRRHDDVSVNYKFRINRICINDLNAFNKDYVTEYEHQGMREMFFNGKHHGSLKINYDEGISVGEY